MPVGKIAMDMSEQLQGSAPLVGEVAPVFRVEEGMGPGFDNRGFYRG